MSIYILPCFSKFERIKCGFTVSEKVNEESNLKKKQDTYRKTTRNL